MEYTEAEELFIIFEYEMLNYKNTPTTYLMLESSTVVKTLMASSKDIFIHLKKWLSYFNQRCMFVGDKKLNQLEACWCALFVWIVMQDTLADTPNFLSSFEDWKQWIDSKT